MNKNNKCRFCGEVPQFIDHFGLQTHELVCAEEKIKSLTWIAKTMATMMADPNLMIDFWHTKFRYEDWNIVLKQAADMDLILKEAV